MQKVEIYHNALEAKWDMEKHIKDDWRVHTCTMSTYTSGMGFPNEEVLVVYEKN